MDRLAAMSTLVAVADAGSLSAGARRLGMPLATVSRRMSDLEAQLGTRLFDRSSRRIALTPAGADYLAACRRILGDVQEAERAAAGEYLAPVGELTITAPVAFGRLHVLPVVLEFLRAQPAVDVRLALTDRSVDLFEEGIDLAVRLARLADSRLIAGKVGEIRRVVCASPAYLAARGVPLRPDDLGRYDCVTFDGPIDGSQWLFGEGQQAITVAVHARLVVTDAEAAVDAAVAGLGITRVLSYQAERAVRIGELAVVLAAFEPPPIPVHLVRRGPMVPQKLRAFIDFAAPRLKRRLHALPGGVEPGSVPAQSSPSS